MYHKPSSSSFLSRLLRALLALVMVVAFVVAAAPVTLAAPPENRVSAPAAINNCETNVAETGLYSLVYQLTIPVDVDYNGAMPAYSVDNSATVGAYDRVGYCLELDSQWVWVSMDDFTGGNAQQTGVPVISVNPNGFQQTVSNMTVDSNVAGVTTGSNITTGNIEFWHNCYIEDVTLNLPGASSSTYDYDDKIDAINYPQSCYGSMQVHNYGAGQTVFAWNQWDYNVGARPADDLGIGNNPGTHPDWTFAANAGSYTTRTLYVYVREVSAVTPGAGGGNGPGSVGITDGSSTLEVWLKADAGVFADTGCTTTAANGTDVACWQDQSGNGLVYTQATPSQQPNYVTGAQNGQPAIQFNRSTSDYLASSSAVLAAGDDTFTYVASWQTTTTGQWQNVFEQNASSVQIGRRASLILSPSNIYGFAGEGNDFHPVPFTAAQYNISTVLLNGATSNNVLVYDEGSVTIGTININTQNVDTSGGTAVGRAITKNDEFFDGQIPEIIVFSAALNDTERILVENYLSAKYGIALSANDLYAGDDNANGDFDLNVAGIGQFGGNQHTQAHAAGMIVVDRSFLNDDGDWLLFGHNVAANSNVTTDLPTTGDWATAPNSQRWARSFYIDVTDNTTGVDCATPGTCTVDIIFDFSEGGMNGSGIVPAGSVSNYRLLKRTGTTGTFSDIATATAIVGDQVQFLGVDVSLLGSNFTLGTLDAGTSPTAVTLESVELISEAGVDTRMLLAIALGVLGGLLVIRRTRR
ncbi:hypothetical protein ARMA_1610 [Ardenticatena maritima]|uniref:Uncharacterized protein n=1 Tax=Ardenticatena maritima TaxID=872965 RepID=A0A0M9UCQ0_9CHLR|nr:hypothetical protein [Ardenticatena maritima]KPL88330.1 hypothetical protein SE16_05750 [Ardenticatena maritima]GAP63187.1 hypothetical protein ARMA_1610 [Ardenticatena maritima]